MCRYDRYWIHSWPSEFLSSAPLNSVNIKFSLRYRRANGNGMRTSIWNIRLLSLLESMGCGTFIFWHCFACILHLTSAGLARVVYSELGSDSIYFISKFQKCNRGSIFGKADF